MIDLHTHSTASDGQYTPAQVVELAQKAGVTTLALTDHDTTAGLAEAQAAAQRLGLTFFPGLELDCRYPGIGGNFHMLGYGIDPTHPALADFCQNFAQQRRERAERIFTYLAERGMPLDRAAVEEKVTGVIGRPHFARAMVEAGYVADTREAFDKYLDTEDFQRIDRPKPHPQEAIDRIRQAGGVAVLAHPNQLKLGERPLKSLLEELKEYGLAGVECYYSTHTPDQTAHYLTLAAELDLLVSAGSDFHGEQVKAGIAIGTGKDGSLRVEGPLSLVTHLQTRKDGSTP